MQKKRTFKLIWAHKLIKTATKKIKRKMKPKPYINSEKLQIYVIN